MEEIPPLVNEIINKIKLKFKIEQNNPIPKIKIENKLVNNQLEEKKVAIFENNELKIFINENKSFFKEFLISEISKLFFPKVLLTIPRSIDIGYYIAYRLSNKKNSWLKKLDELSKVIILKNIGYRPFYDLNEIDKVTDGKAIKLILEYFTNIGKFKDNLNLEEYLFFFDSLQKGIIGKLTEKEYKILIEISNYNEPNMKNSAKNIKMNNNTFLKNYYKLKKHTWLNFLAFINWPKIGLELFVVRINPINKFTNLVKEKLMKPYIRVLHQLGSGEASKLLFTCALPFGTGHLLEKYSRELEHSGYISDYNIIRPLNYSHTINMDAFNIKSNTWEISKKKIKAYMQNNIDPKKLIKNRLDFDYSKERGNFDRIDIQILFELEKPPGIETTLSLLSKKLKLSKKIVSSRLNKLKENEFYISYPTLYPPLINLPETLFTTIISKNRETITKIEALFNNMPYNYLMGIEDGYGVISIDSLPGEMNYITRILSKQIMGLENIIEVNMFLEHISYGIKQIPVNLFSEEGWIKPSEFWW